MRPPGETSGMAFLTQHEWIAGYSQTPTFISQKQEKTRNITKQPLKFQFNSIIATLHQSLLPNVAIVYDGKILAGPSL